MKRFVDIIGSIFLMIILFPMILIVGLTIACTSRGGIFFRQERVGLYGKPFYILKFRTMYDNAKNSGPYYTLPNDKRITFVGRFIRMTSLDEIPQVLNVLNGEMSFVGPRPDVPTQKVLYTAEEWRKRHLVRPGITGLAQAMLRSAATPEERKNLDLEYAQYHSFILDIKIIFITFIQLFKKNWN